MSADWLLGLDLGGGGARALALEVSSGRIEVARRRLSPTQAPDTAGLGLDLDPDRAFAAIAAAAREVLERGVTSYFQYSVTNFQQRQLQTQSY